MTALTPEVPATLVSRAGEVWFLYLACRRPEPATIHAVNRVDVARTSIVTVVVGKDDSTIRLMEPDDLPPGELGDADGDDADSDVGVVGTQHVEAVAVALVELLKQAPGSVVLAAVDLVVQRAARQALDDLEGGDLGQVVVADTVEAGVRVVAMLSAGEDVQDVLHSPGFSVALSVADAGIGAAASTPTGETLITRTLVTVDENPAAPRDTPWLTIGDQTIEVRTHGMSRWSASAVTVRAGRARRVTEPEPRRLLMGPANYAGQGGAWAQAVREHVPGWTARNVHVVAPSAVLVFGSDLPLTTLEWAEPGTRLDLAVELVVGATDIVVEAMRPMLAVRDASDAANITDEHRAREDVDALRASGRNVAFLFHGSEVRRPRENARLTPWSPFYRTETWALTAAHERKTERVHAALAGFDGLVLVSTPDLLDHVPGAVWLPIVVGEVSFLPTEPALTRARPVVAHAPSSGWLKGSEWVDPVLQRLDADGLLTYRRLENLSPIMVPALLREVDVVVDQVVLGNPGVLAAQAMATGRLVLAHLPEGVRRRFPDPPPVVETNPETIEAVLLSVIENPEHYAKIAARGVGFARKFHDGRMSARILTEALTS